MRLPSIDTILPRLAVAAAAGVVLVIAGRVADIELAMAAGAALMAPMTLIAGGACLLVVLLAPAWPLSSMAPRVPRLLWWPFLSASLGAVGLWWWCVWACIAAGPGAPY